MSVTLRQKGFTIVELLIVIVIIAILAAITIVAYNGIQNRANDSSVQSDMRGLAQKIMQHEAINGEYPSTGSNGYVMPAGITYSVNKSAYASSYNLYYCLVRSGPNARFAIVAQSVSGNRFVYKGGSFAEYTGSSFSSHTNICPGAGIATNETGYEYHYGKGSADNWYAWTN